MAFKDDVSDFITHVKVLLSQVIWKLKLKGEHLHLVAAFPDRVGCLLSLLFAFDSSFHTHISQISNT